MCVFKYHAFIYFLHPPPPWPGTINLPKIWCKKSFCELVCFCKEKITFHFHGFHINWDDSICENTTSKKMKLKYVKCTFRNVALKQNDEICRYLFRRNFGETLPTHTKLFYLSGKNITKWRNSIWGEPLPRELGAVPYFLTFFSLWMVYGR